jgi:hypothetical protein
MLEIFREAGWGIYPVTIFGLAAIACSAMYARRLEARWHGVGLGMAAMTVFAGILGSVKGMQRSAEGLHQVASDERWIFLLGVRESLQNMVVAMVLLSIAVLLLTVGAWRNHPPTRRDAQPVGRATRDQVDGHPDEDLEGQLPERAELSFNP